MRNWNRFKMIIPGMFILVFMLSSCQKDDSFDYLLAADEPDIELREKCTKIEKSTTVSASVPTDPNPVQVEDALRPGLQDAVNNEKNPIVRAVLNSILVSLPGESVIMSNFLGETDVAGLTRPFFKYVTYRGKLYIVVVNLILLEQPQFKEHEEGHAYIAEEIAKKCSEKAAKESGKECEEAGPDVESKLKELNDKAQKAYEKATNSGTTGNQAKEAKKAAKAVIDEYLKKK